MPMAICSLSPKAYTDVLRRKGSSGGDVRRHITLTEFPSNTSVREETTRNVQSTIVANSRERACGYYEFEEMMTA